jgi:hypothetical protein
MVISAFATISGLKIENQNAKEMILRAFLGENNSGGILAKLLEKFQTCMNEISKKITTTPPHNAFVSEIFRVWSALARSHREAFRTRIFPEISAYVYENLQGEDFLRLGASKGKKKKKEISKEISIIYFIHSQSLKRPHQVKM